MTVYNRMSTLETVTPEPLPATGGINFVDILRILRVRHKIILGTALVIATLVTVAVLQMTPVYSASSVVMLDSRKNNITDANAVLADLTSDPSTIQNQVAILTSLRLLGRVVDKLKLENDPEFNPQLSPAGVVLQYLNPMNWFKSATQDASSGDDVVRNQVINKLLSQVSVVPVGLSTAMTITVRSIDAVKSAKIANTIASAYVDDQLEAKFDATKNATQWLSQRISELSNQSQAADAAVQQYKAAHNITTTANGLSVVSQQVADLNSQLILAKTDLAEKQASYDQLASLARSGQADTASQTLASTAIVTLRSQEADISRQIADLSTKYGARHPKMLDLQAQKSNIEARIADEVQRVVAAEKNTLLAAQAHVASLEQSMRQLEARSAGQDQESVRLAALQSAATSARAMYEAFLGRLNQTQDQQGIQTPDARVISDAQVPLKPSAPKKVLSIALGIVGGLLLGVLIAFAAEYLDVGFRTAQQTEEALQVPVLSSLPEIFGDKQEIVNPADNLVAKPMSSYAEGVRGVLLGLSLSNVDKPPRVVLVTSSVPGEGKTTVSLSLARMAARSGLKVALVDCDGRRPSVGEHIGADRSGYSLIDALSGDQPIENYLRDDTLTSAKILTCIPIPVDPVDVLSSSAMRNTVQRLRESFDLVILDSAPLLPVHDTRVLTKLADAVLFCVRWEKTPRQAAVNCMRVLADLRTPILGVVLTRADSERFRYYNYGYQDYGQYARYYSS